MASPYATPWAWQQSGGHMMPGGPGGRTGSPWHFGQAERVSWSNDTSPMPPSLLDPMIYMGRRQTPSSMSSSRPYGNLWQSAAQWMSRMPALVGR
ncbi:MAG TPA: hypothetical protein VM238_23015 [Phycisphaerae bacterium]|nr:hypothetical protein [Phycisphaerae bacterium]